MPATPKAISSGRRPTLSDRAPITGWDSMNSTMAAAVIRLAAPLEKPEVLTRNFWM